MAFITSLISLLAALSFFLVFIPCNARLKHDFYKKTCPNVEKIIYNVASKKLLEAPVTAAGALRIFFHDCFVEV